ncbi:hypothetical protein SAMN05444008_1119 [Cnuella takakiae]|uniref:Uncharacterized protein n=1 Tax=Cnuella takakiae TaxID=1302690 RepID=A0A1M5DMX1_9BACT|nr:hypothetical protein [Cnuella takakiae]OLY93934.1 hypothetical protein BUE76_20155 [Cnuella takakiae]SHF68310.1 hypothetical protein SAMN05444008_1119 [Cnuella takakiae]
MRSKIFTYDQVFQRFHSLLMMVLLLWLTVSAPVVYAAQQDTLVAWHDLADDDDSGNPLSGTNEEKVEGGATSLSEYLHEVHPPLPPLGAALAAFKAHAAETLQVFHPELLSPPPEFTL